MPTNEYDPVLESALEEARHPAVANALRKNVELGLMTVSQAENGEFLWSITDKGREHIGRQSN